MPRPKIDREQNFNKFRGGKLWTLPFNEGQVQDSVVFFSFWHIGKYGGGKNRGPPCTKFRGGPVERRALYLILGSGLGFALRALGDSCLHTWWPTILATPKFPCARIQKKKSPELATLYNDRVQDLPPPKIGRVQNLGEFVASSGLCPFLRVASSGLCHLRGLPVQYSVVFLHSGK